MSAFDAADPLPRCLACDNPYVVGQLTCESCGTQLPALLPYEESQQQSSGAGKTKESANVKHEVDNGYLQPFLLELERARKQGTKIVVNIGFSGAGKSWLSARMGADLTDGTSVTCIYSSDVAPQRAKLKSGMPLPQTLEQQVRVWYLDERPQTSGMLIIDLAGELAKQLERDSSEVAGALGPKQLLKVALAYADAIIIVIDGYRVTAAPPQNVEQKDAPADEMLRSLIEETVRMLLFVRSVFADRRFPDTAQEVSETVSSFSLLNPSLHGKPGERSTIPTYFAITKADLLPPPETAVRSNADRDTADQHTADQAGGAPAQVLCSADATYFALRYLPKTHEKARKNIVRFRFAMVAPFAGKEPPKDNSDRDSELVDFELHSYGVRELFDWLQAELRPAKRRNELPLRQRLRHALPTLSTEKALSLARVPYRTTALPAAGEVSRRFLHFLKFPAVAVALLLATILVFWHLLKPAPIAMPPLPIGVPVAPGQGDFRLSLDEAKAFDAALLQPHNENELRLATLPPLVPQLGGDFHIWTQPQGLNNYEQVRDVVEQMHACSFRVECDFGKRAELGSQAANLVSRGNSCDAGAVIRSSKLARVPMALHAMSLAWRGNCTETATKAFEELAANIARHDLSEAEMSVGSAYTGFSLAKLRFNLDLTRTKSPRPDIYLSELRKAHDIVASLQATNQRFSDGVLASLGISRNEMDAELKLAHLIDLLRTNEGDKLDIAVQAAKLADWPADLEPVAASSAGTIGRRQRFIACALAFRFHEPEGFTRECLIRLEQETLPAEISAQVQARLAMIDGSWAPDNRLNCARSSKEPACVSLRELASRASTWATVRSQAESKATLDSPVVQQYLRGFAAQSGNPYYWLRSAPVLALAVLGGLLLLLVVALVLSFWRLLFLAEMRHLFPGAPRRD